MCATSKGFILSKEVAEWVLGLVDVVAASKYKDFPPMREGSVKGIFPNFNYSFFEIDRNKSIYELASDEEKDFIFALELRKSYGGSAGINIPLRILFFILYR